MMKENINSFSFRRVGLLITRDVVENRKNFLFFTLVLSVIFLFIMFTSAWVTPAGEEAYLTLSIKTLNGYKTVFTYYNIFVFSGIMANMQTQGARANFLMLPASNIEKFLGRLLYVALLVFVPYIVAILLADVLHMMIFPFFAGESDAVATHSLLLGFWEVKGKMLQEGQETLNMYINLPLYLLLFIDCLLFVWESSIYVLGGCYWRKHPFLKTFASILFVTIVAIAVLGYSFWKIASEVKAPVEALQIWMDEYLGGISQTSLLLICAGVFFVWTLLNFYGAYRLFCHRQVDEPKRVSL